MTLIASATNATCRAVRSSEKADCRVTQLIVASGREQILPDTSTYQHDKNRILQSTKE